MCKPALVFRLLLSGELNNNRAQFPLSLNIKFRHNHALNRAEFLRYQSVSADTKPAFTELFQQGVTPSAAHAEVKQRIKEQFPDIWPNKFADRSVTEDIGPELFMNNVPAGSL